MKYLYKIGTVETYVYDESVNGLADDCDGVLSLEQIKYAIKQLREHGNKYFHIIDAFALLQYFIESEGVNEALVIEKSESF